MNRILVVFQSYFIISILPLFMLFHFQQPALKIIGQEKYNGYCKVNKIDSIGSFYTINCGQEDKIIKIVSQNYKVPEVDCRRLIVDSNYYFDLQPLFKDSILLAGKNVKIMPSLSTRRKCIGSAIDSTVICFDRDSVSNVYVAINLKGLCFP